MDLRGRQGLSPASRGLPALLNAAGWGGSARQLRLDPVALGLASQRLDEAQGEVHGRSGPPKVSTLPSRSRPVLRTVTSLSAMPCRIPG